MIHEFSSVAGTDLLLFVLAVTAFGVMWVIGWTAAAIENRPRGFLKPVGSGRVADDDAR